ncbi:MAG: hypothetical protein RQ751_09565 [Longimicrobiales bacterium]|nr:hypothetical protein [Longimicrobiales bacterium]
MKQRYALPAGLIVVVAVALVLVNEFTDLAFARDYALLILTVAMLLGVWLARRSGKADTHDAGGEDTR